MNNVKVGVIDCHVVYWEGEIPQFLTIKDLLMKDIH